MPGACVGVSQECENTRLHTKDDPHACARMWTRKQAQLFNTPQMQRVRESRVRMHPQYIRLCTRRIQSHPALRQALMQQRGSVGAALLCMPTFTCCTHQIQGSIAWAPIACSKNIAQENVCLAWDPHMHAPWPSVDVCRPELSPNTQHVASCLENQSPSPMATEANGRYLRKHLSSLHFFTHSPKYASSKCWKNEVHKSLMNDFESNVHSDHSKRWSNI
jgi:hypothetical protein